MTWHASSATPPLPTPAQREHPAARHRAGGIAGRDEHDIDACCDQAPGEDVDDVLGATVGDGGTGSQGGAMMPTRSGLRVTAWLGGSPSRRWVMASMVPGESTSSKGHRTLSRAISFSGNGCGLLTLWPLPLAGFVDHGSMWIDERGSEVLDAARVSAPSCYRRQGTPAWASGCSPRWRTAGPAGRLRRARPGCRRSDRGGVVPPGGCRLVAFQVDGMTQGGIEGGSIHRSGACWCRVWPSRTTKTFRRAIFPIPRWSIRVDESSVSVPTL